MSAIATAEANGPLASRSALFEWVSDIYNATTRPETYSEPITKHIARKRASKWKLEIKTPLDKPGGEISKRQAVMQAARGARQSRVEKWAKNPEIQDSLVQIEAATPAKYRDLAEGVKAGSIRDAVSLHCLECVGYQPLEVKHCEMKSCAFWPFRHLMAKPSE